MKEFTINIPDEVIEGIKKRVADYPWGKCYMATPDSWEAGTDLEYLKEFCKYWVEKYDWRTHEAELNRFPQYMATVDGIDIHFIMEKGSGDAPKPLLMAHGWPVPSASAARRRTPLRSSPPHCPVLPFPVVLPILWGRVAWPGC